MPSPLPTDDAIARLAAKHAAPQASDEISLEWLPVADLRIDGRYQRKLSDASLRVLGRIVKGFSWARFGALSVSRAADGTLLVVDGQHRAVAAAHLGIERVPCLVFAAETEAQAASFVGINADRTGVTRIDKFRAQLAAGDAKARGLANMLAIVDLRWDVPSAGPLAPGTIRCIARLEALRTRYGIGTVQTALEIMIEAQPEQPD